MLAIGRRPLHTTSESPNTRLTSASEYGALDVESQQSDWSHPESRCTRIPSHLSLRLYCPMSLPGSTPTGLAGSTHLITLCHWKYNLDRPRAFQECSSQVQSLLLIENLQGVKCPNLRCVIRKEVVPPGSGDLHR